MARVYFDTCAFIEAFERSGPASQALLRCLAREPGRSLTVVASELTLAEILELPIREGARRNAAFYKEFLRTSPILSVIPVSRAILIDAAELKAQGAAAKLPDAIHVATAVREGCESLVTNDRRLRTRAGIRLIGFDAALVEGLLAP